jgi:outer membrane protein assembly complex protein YaeT
LVLGLAAAGPSSRAAGPLAKPSMVKVSGTGFLQDRELRVSLERLLDTAHLTTLDVNAIEDAAVILASTLGEQGFQKPAIEIVATLADGSERKFAFDPTMQNPLPRPLAASRVEFRVKPGARWHIDAVAIEGLTVFPLKEARNFFHTEAMLIGRAQANAYSPSRLSRAADALLGEVLQRGYAEATVRAEPARVDEKNGAVAVHVTVTEGPRWELVSVSYEGGGDTGVKLPAEKDWTGKPWSPAVQQNLTEVIRQAFFQKGYPDVSVKLVPRAGAAQGERKDVTAIATIRPGPQVTLGAVRFEGNAATHGSVLQRRVEVSPGEPLNPLAIEHARYRLSRLGVFETIDVHYDPPDGTTRAPVFTLKEGPRYETNLLLGYGSYEQLRGGVELRQMNVFGLAHQSRLELIQSMKSTEGDYTYTVPELFGESIDGSVQLFGLQRQEIAFQRQEFGANATLKRKVAWIGGDASVGYTFQALRNRKNGLATEATDEKQVNVAAFDFGLTGDRRDNPLRPRRGYHWSAQVEVAHPNLGGAAEYQRAEISGAYHTPWGGGRWLHLGFAHGVITTYGAISDAGLPVNKRFYPGGDNSIRGYQRGEAAPRGADGRFVGAKSYVLLNVELEQAITSNWSVVAFGDALGDAAQLKNYPFDERLYSAGLGVRYQTLIGPVRVEYGRNISPRPGDPPGTWQISIGYPF